MAVNASVLRKILELEGKKGYPDNAVIGGLDKFLTSWLDQIEKTSPGKTLLKRVHSICPPNPAYASMTSPLRQKWSREMLALLKDLESPPAKSKPEGSKAATLPVVRRKLVAPVKDASVASKTKPTASGALLDVPVTVIKGVSDVLSKKFEKLGVKTVRDLLYFFPNRQDRKSVV